MAHELTLFALDNEQSSKAKVVDVDAVVVELAEAAVADVAVVASTGPTGIVRLARRACFALCPLNAID